MRAPTPNAALAFVLLLAGCAAAPPRGELTRFERAELERREQRLAAGRAGPREPERERELAALVCRLDAGSCGRVRVYVLARAGRQAHLWPNDVLVVGSPLLAVADADEQAFAIAHEVAHRVLGHFRARHGGRDGGTGIEVDVDLEVEADAWAQARVSSLGGRGDAGHTLLARLRQELEDPDARAELDRRIGALDPAR